MMPDQFRTLIAAYQNLPVAIYICDQEDKLRAFNLAAGQLLATKPRLGHEVWYPECRIFDPEGKRISSNYRPVSNALRSTHKNQLRELLFVEADGRKKQVLVSSTAILSETGAYSGAIHSLTDISLQHSYEERQALLASIVGSSEDAIISKDLDGLITSWNPAAELLFGYTASEAIGRPISLIIPDERLPEEKRIIAQIKRGEKVAHFETVRSTKDGRLIAISPTISPILNQAGKVVGASKIARDITLQKEADRQLQLYATELENLVRARTSNLEETVVALAEAKDEVDRVLAKERELGLMKSRFVSTASHEFRTPLSAIKLSASLIARYAANDQKDQVEKHTEKIKRSVADLTAILGDFLSLEKLESGKVEVKWEDLNLPAVVADIVEAMELLCKPGQQIICLHEGSTGPVRLDQQLLQHCLNNLLSNAIKYSGNIRRSN